MRRRFLFAPVICIVMLALIILYRLILATGFFDIDFDKVDSCFIARSSYNSSISNLKHPTIPKTKAEGRGSVDINNATADVLDTVPEIGEKRSEAIIGQRREMGGFSCINDLICTPGIAAGMLNDLEPYIRISEYEGE